MHIIHKKIYNLAKFDHPGGNYILELCKNEPDCSALFESYHAFCDMEKIKKIMKKYEVGDTDISMFSFEKDGFYNICKQRVNDILTYEESKANLSWFITILFSTFLFIFCQYVLLFWNHGLFKGIISLLSGISLVSLGYNVLHDGSHYSISKYYIVNQVCCEFIQALLFMNNTLWSYHHCIRHHQYTGNYIWDPDMRNSQPFLRKTLKLHQLPLEFSNNNFDLKYALFNIIFPGTALGQSISYHITRT